MGAAIASIAAAMSLMFQDAASADDGVVCPAGDLPWLRILFTGNGFASLLRAKILEQLGADLRRHDLVLCDPATGDRGQGAGEPLAEIGIALSADSVLSLEVRDAVTDKSMARTLPLGSVPRDALALSITLAVEELLHASWIEAALAPPRAADGSAPAATAKPVPAAVRAVNAEEIARIPQVASAEPAANAQARSPMTAQVAVLGAVERATGSDSATGQTDLGGDLRFMYGGRLAVSARAGLRTALDVPSAHGTVSGHEFLAGAGLAYAIARRAAPWGAELGLRADVIDVSFKGTASAGSPVQAASDSALGAVLSGALGGWGRLGGPWRVVAEAALGVPVRAVTASDVGAKATGIAGVTLGVALGIAATVPE